MMKTASRFLVRAALISTSFAVWAVAAGKAQQAAPQPAAQSLVAQVDRRIVQGSALDAIRKVYENRLLADTIRGDRNNRALSLDRFAVRVQPSIDLQDRTPLPNWFRAYLRGNFPTLPTTGQYQYPRASFEILEWMLAHQNLRRAVTSPAVGGVRRSLDIGGNINITNLDERDSESSIAIDKRDPRLLVAASNDPSGSGLQRQFSSANGGTTWLVSALPFPPVSAELGYPQTAMQCDPSVAFTTDGTAWTATLGIDGTGSSMAVQMYRSVDQGKTWLYAARLSNTPTNDKEMLTIDTSETSPFKNSIYVAWDVPGSGIRFNRSLDGGKTWRGVTALSTDNAIGVHVATGPKGELYIAWPEITSKKIIIKKSTDGGDSFPSTSVIATTTGAYDIRIPAMCERNALIYVTLGVDKSSGPRRGTVYATWTDVVGTEPQCPVVGSGHSAILFSQSTDGVNWSSRRVIHDVGSTADQFNQWMDVDQDGSIHVIFYDTRDDARRQKTHLYYIASTDGGANWINERRVTTAPTDETASGADPFGNQYGDYNGLVVFSGVAHPIWTDRRTAGGKEQIFTATVSTAGPLMAIKSPHKIRR